MNPENRRYKWYVVHFCQTVTASRLLTSHATALDQKRSQIAKTLVSILRRCALSVTALVELESIVEPLAHHDTHHTCTIRPSTSDHACMNEDLLWSDIERESTIKGRDTVGFYFPVGITLSAV